MNRQKFIFKRMFAILMTMMLIMTGCAAESISKNSDNLWEDDSIKDASSQDRSDDASSKKSTGELEVHFIDVGQGDSILIKYDKHAMMVDFGENDQGTYLQNYLDKQGVKKLDYAIGTHPDSDHIGSMDVILYKFDVGSIFMPDIESDTRTYEDVIKTVENKNYKVTVPKVNKSYKLGDASFTILSPASSDYSSKNDYSIGIKLTYKNTSFVMCGDAESDAETDIIGTGIDLSADVLKLGHHGSSSSTSDAFLDSVNPLVAVISCGIDNSYGHPHKETMEKLQQRNISIYRTDEQGTVVAYSDGNDIVWSDSFSTDYSSGNELSGTESGKSGTKKNNSNKDTTYVINTNTRKFHLPDCSSVSQMSSKNKLESNDTKDELINEGYEPCKNCLE